MSPYLKSILLRLIKGFVSGAFTSVSLISLADVHLWTDLGAAVNILLVSAIAGGINGLFLAGEKAITWQDTQNVV